MCSIKSSTQKHVKNSTPFFPVHAANVHYQSGTTGFKET